MRYFCIDFETANSNPGSICSVGIVAVENGKNVREFYSLVNPESRFDEFCTMVHGISETAVETAPKVREILPTIEQFVVEFENLIAHYSAFDIRHLIGAYAKHGAHLPNIRSIICTRSVARLAFPGRISYSLHELTDVFRIEYDAHNALGDAKACAALLNACFAVTNTDNLDDLCKTLLIKQGNITNGDYAKCFATKSHFARASAKIEVVAETSVFDENHPFFEQEVVFTGTLDSMKRADAAQLVVNCGGVFSDTLRKTTNYLVMGMQDIRMLNGKQKSSKASKAESLLAAGADIQIISEDDFLAIAQS